MLDSARVVREWGFNNQPVMHIHSTRKKKLQDRKGQEERYEMVHRERATHIVIAARHSSLTLPAIQKSRREREVPVTTYPKENKPINGLSQSNESQVKPEPKR